MEQPSNGGTNELLLSLKQTRTSHDLRFPKIKANQKNQMNCTNCGHAHWLHGKQENWDAAPYEWCDADSCKCDNFAPNDDSPHRGTKGNLMTPKTHIEIVAFGCAYCPMVSRYKKNAIRHQATCYQNPNTKACITCAHYSVYSHTVYVISPDPGSCDYEEDRHWCDRLNLQLNPRRSNCSLHDLISGGVGELDY